MARQRRAFALILLATACGAGEPVAQATRATPTVVRPDDDAAPPTPAWQGASSTGETVSGAFTAHLDSPHPGGGWFELRDADGAVSLAGSSFSRAVRHSVEGATHDVMAVQIHGLPREGGWSIVEVDVSLDKWLVGDIELASDDAVGHLTRPDGSEAWLLEGILRLSAPGVVTGDVVRGELLDATVWEVAR